MGSSFNKCEKLSNNTIGDGFCDNIISTGVGFKNNRIYNDFKNNNISVYSFDSNYIESNFSFNVLSSEEFSGNYIGGSCSNNLIYAVVTNCTLGQQVLNNIFESCDITSMNLISSQHLSQNYNCRIFSRFGGELRISYVDEDDLILITYLGA
jgi:hypothetical protein